MGDFFYYGQKDTIRRLNELAGRGAVVASYVPAVGRSPLGGPNGYMNPAWLDPNLPISTNVPVAVSAVSKYGYSFLQGGQGQRLYKIATLPQSISSTYSSLRIDALLGGWAAYDLTAMTILIGSRVNTSAEGISVDWSTSRYVPTNVRFLVFLEADNSISVYLFFLAGSFAQASFQMMGMGATTYASPVPVNTVPGTAIWDSSSPPDGPLYRSPRSRGMGAAGAPNGTSFDRIVEVRSQDGNASTVSYIAGAPRQDSTAVGVENEVLRLGIAANAGVNYAGFMNWSVSAGVGSVFKESFVLSLKARDTGTGTFSGRLFSVSGAGQVYLPWLKAGSSEQSARHHISAGTGQNAEILYIGVDKAPAPSVAVLASDGASTWAAPTAVLYVGKNSVTGRSIASGGTITGQGSDYAEYFWKCPSCAGVTAGQVVGINDKNQITDLWAEAVMFAIKSTDPSFVGGDSWANDIGPRPLAQAGAAPTQPTRREDVLTQQAVPGTNPPQYEDVITEPGDTDDEWAEKQAAYTAALAAHTAAVHQNAGAMATFDAALEVERQKVDRIAIAGRVPVNVLGAQSGDYIVPVQDGIGIMGIPVCKADLTHSQYLDAVGRVISIEPDGRAYVMVKVV